MSDLIPEGFPVRIPKEILVGVDGLDGSEDYIVVGLLRARPGLPVNPKPVGGDADE